MVKNILVPVDGSEGALRAVAAAVALAKQTRAKLQVLHVMPRLGSGRIPKELEQFAELEHVRITESEVMQGVAREVVARAVGEARAKGLEVPDGRIEVGEPSATIAQVAESGGFDLIVMGRRGLNDLEGLLMGSVSHRVARRAGCPVMTVP